MEKTNAMRLLDSNKIKYEILDYTKSGVISGVDVANYLNEDTNQAFKTLVTIGKSGKNYVFVVPVSSELDLKKASISVGEKNIAMIHQSELYDLTGYIHGGCSPIGMKKKFMTVLDNTVNNYDEIFISGGKVGLQIKIKVNDLIMVTNSKVENIRKE